MIIQHDIIKTRLLGALILITLLTLSFQTYGPKKVLVLGQDSGFAVHFIDDREGGGKSIARLNHEGKNLVIDCEIIASDYGYPYCELSFTLVDAYGKGMDLSNFEQIKLWAKYSEPQAFGMRLQLINYNPAYSRAGDNESMKYNSIELFDTHERYPNIINLRNMQVATWWLSERKIAADYWGPEFTDVRSVQISTGEHVTPGKYQMIVERVELSGKYISDRSLYLILISLWTTMAVVFFVTALRSQKELITNKQHQLQLEELNRLLSQEHLALEHRLTRDPLTGVLNREGLAPLFKQDWNPNSPQLLSLIFIDIDHFKNINDTYGHNTGDQVLLAFAQTLSENTRTQDFLARWGGEEFVLACPDTALENTLGLAEKLRRAIEGAEWPKNLQVTASFGVAQLVAGESPTEFIARADRALYVAKAQGRNCVRASTQEAVS